MEVLKKGLDGIERVIKKYTFPERCENSVKNAANTCHSCDATGEKES